MEANVRDWLLVLAILSVIVVACRTDEDDATYTAGESGAASSNEGSAGTDSADRSSTAEAQRLLSSPIDGPDAVKAVIQEAQALRKLLADGSDQADLAPMHVGAAGLDLLAIAGAAAIDGSPEAAARDKGAFEELLRQIAVLPSTVGEGHGRADEALRLQEAALVLLGTSPQIKDVRLNRASARELAVGTTFAGTVVRTVWMARLEDALAGLADMPQELRTESFARLVGRLLCERCADAHHVTPDKVTHFLLNPSNTGGIVCGSALQVGRSAKTPPMEIAAMSTCEDLRLSAGRAEPTLLWSTNVLVLAAYRLASELVAAPLGDGPLARVMGEQAGRLEALLSRPVRLPVPTVSAPPAAGSDDATPWNVLVDGLGAAGLSITDPSMGFVYVGPEGVRVGLPPLVALREGQVVSISAAKGLPAGGRLILPYGALQQAEPTAETPIGPISSAVSEWKRAARSLEPERGSGFPEDAAAPVMEVVVDGRTPVWAVAKTVDALRLAGIRDLRFTKTGTHGQALPLLVRQEPVGLRETLKIGTERPMLAVVGTEHLDLWAPAGKRAGAASRGKKGKKGKPPEGFALGYRDKQLVRLRMPLGGQSGAGLDGRALALLARGIAYLARHTRAEPLLHVVGMDDASAADVLRVAAVFQERPGRPLAEPDGIWPGTECGGRAYSARKRKPSGCATGVAVAFATTRAPSPRGLTSRPGGKDEKPAEPKAQAGFCDKKDIARSMKKRRGSFRFCYERELRMNKGLEGRVVLRLTVGKSGSVQGTPRIASSTLNSPAVHKCLVTQAKKVQFSPPDGGVCSVRWPIKFQAK